jgi:F-type H+-transporting ATPase subunit gamma
VKREVELERRLASLEALGEAVGAMKSLSAHHFREARKAVEPARRYREGVARLLAWSGASVAPGGGGAGLLIIGAELGLCGGYNVRVVEAGAARRAALHAGPTFCVGHRAAMLLARRGIQPSQVYPAPTSVGGITGLLLRLGEVVLDSYAAGLQSFDIVASRFVGVGRVQPASVRLLPFDAEPSDGGRPARYVRADSFASAAIREFLYITLYDLLLDALASEHGARLVATQAAERWLDERTARLRRHIAATRRETSTQEMIEIATGARARGERRSGAQDWSGIRTLPRGRRT